MFDRKAYMKAYNRNWHLRNGAIRNKQQAVYKKLWAQKNQERLKAKQQKFYKDNRLMVIEQTKIWRKNNPDKHAAAKRRYHLKRKFGLSANDYESMLVKQNGNCAICQHPPLEVSLAVDHCHKTNKIRGLLCLRCNRGIGQFYDNAELLNRASIYLKESYE